jgi:pimeloyl-ACP methyl ester carboxylesterase
MLAVDLSFEEFGHSDNASLIILHGFFASSRNWRQVAEKLAVRFHVYVLDMRNHGVSPHHDLMDYPAMTTDLLLFMDVHKLSTVSLLGHSMGGKVAMWFALNYPERLDKLIVVDIAPVSYTHCFNNLIQALKELPLHQINNRKEAELWLADYIPEQSYRQFLLQNLILKEGAYCWRVNLDTFYRMAHNIIAFPSVESVTPYAGRVLFLGGENSGYIKGEDISDLFPNALINIIAKAGHWLHVQQPIVFIEEVESYLESTQKL